MVSDRLFRMKALIAIGGPFVWLTFAGLALFDGESYAAVAMIGVSTVWAMHGISDLEEHTDG